MAKHQDNDEPISEDLQPWVELSKFMDSQGKVGAYTLDYVLRSLIYHTTPPGSKKYEDARKEMVSYRQTMLEKAHEQGLSDEQVEDIVKQSSTVLRNALQNGC